MKIALVGYGKMGKAIEHVALQRGHEIVLKISSKNIADLNEKNLRNADVAIEFTNPENAEKNIHTCLTAGIPVVCGSTGWTKELRRVYDLVETENGSFIHASNYSVGMNIFFDINQRLAALMNQQTAYGVQIKEIHHTQKKDAPSGTAITIADQIMDKIGRKKRWVNHISENPDDLEIISERIDPAPGTHHVLYSSAIDDIEIIHTAHNREGFALGAVLAAEYIRDKKGVFTMKNVLGI